MEFNVDTKTDGDADVGTEHEKVMREIMIFPLLVLLWGCDG